MSASLLWLDFCSLERSDFRRFTCQRKCCEKHGAGRWLFTTTATPFAPASDNVARVVPSVISEMLQNQRLL